jgi:hypothetical protein
VKRVLALVAGAIGFGALLRRRRHGPVLELGPSPADDLRAKLAETRTAAADRPAVDEPATAEAQADDAQLEEAQVDKAQVGEARDPDPGVRRQTVHDRAREAIDELG